MTMRLKELRGLPVIDPSTARKIGTVTDYQVDASAGQVAALDISGVDAGDTLRIMADGIHRIGRSAVVLTRPGAGSPPSPPQADERWLDTATLSGLTVLGEAGKPLGKLVDARLDQDSLAIETYELRAAGWRGIIGRRRHIQPAQVSACSREAMLVTLVQNRQLLASDQSATTLSLSLPLKDADRLPVPSLDQAALDRAPEEQTAAAKLS